MPITYYPSHSLIGTFATLVLPLGWGNMWDDAENPLTAATLPKVPAYDTATTGDFDCDTQTNAGTKTDIWWLVMRVPSDYVAGTNLTFKLDGLYTLGGDAVKVAATVDCEAFPYDSTNGDFSNTDICATAAQNLATSYGTASFTLTGTSLTPGGEVLLRFTSVIQITSAGGAGTGMDSFNNPRVEYTGVRRI